MSAVAGDRLPGLLGHELRNPLASAMTNAMLARDLVDDGDPRAAVLDGVLRDLDRMTGLIDDWLRIARGLPVSRTELDMEALLRRVAAQLRAEVVSVPPRARAFANSGLLERVLENLCENARKAGAQRVRIAAHYDIDELLIHVEDDGAGIAAEDVLHVFEAGWSGSGSTGLGLHAVAGSIGAMGGRVSCVPLERGTRFTITVPRRESES